MASSAIHGFDFFFQLEVHTNLRGGTYFSREVSESDMQLTTGTSSWICSLPQWNGGSRSLELLADSGTSMSRQNASSYSF